MPVGNTILALALLLASIAPVLPWFHAPIVGSLDLFQVYQLSEFAHQLDGSQPAALPWQVPGWTPVVPMVLSLLALAALRLLRRKPISARVTVLVLMVVPGAIYGDTLFRLAANTTPSEFMGFAGVGVYAAVAGVLVSVVAAVVGIVLVARSKRVNALALTGDPVPSEGNYRAPVSPAQGNWPTAAGPTTSNVEYTTIFTDGLKALAVAGRNLYDFGGGWPNLKLAITRAVPAMNAALMAMQAAQPYLSGEARTIADRATPQAQQMVAALESAQGWLTTDNYVNANLCMDAYSSAAQACNGYVGEWYAKVRLG
ncbi:MAG: hypothetical protein Q8P61_06535 [Candidatus Nanopelagicales bacterium]|nr:hypothetical protein [Candidatus Nanopelagicales bacterium]